MSAMLEIPNDGIVATNYWASSYAARGAVRLPWLQPR